MENIPSKQEQKQISEDLSKDLLKEDFWFTEISKVYVLYN